MAAGPVKIFLRAVTKWNQTYGHFLIKLIEMGQLLLIIKTIKNYKLGKMKHMAWNCNDLKDLTLNH